MSVFRNFLISFILAAIIFGAVAFFAVGIIDRYVLNPEQIVETEENNEPNLTAPETDNSNTQEISGNGTSFGILFMLNDYRPDVYSDYTVPEGTLGVVRKKKIESFVYCFFSKEKNELAVMPLDSRTLVIVEGVEMTLSDAYNYYGGAYVSRKISNLIGISIDYYIDFGVQSLIQTVDYLGGFDYELSFDLVYNNQQEKISVNLEKGNRHLDGQSVVSLLRYDDYKSNNGKMNTAGDFVLNALYSFAGNYLNKVRFNTIYNFIASKCETDIQLESIEKNVDLLFKMTNMKLSYLIYPASFQNNVFIPDVFKGKKLFDTYR